MKLRVMQPRVKAASVRSRKIKTAAELKCYDRDSQRIVTRQLKFAEGDFVFIVLGAVILVACVFTQFFLHLLIS
jgi:energy-coupling factor transporter transmembrane protein EcfT